MKATFRQSRLSGTVQAPPSKSMLHRLLICAGLSDGISVIDNTATSQDILATIDCLEKIGCFCERKDGRFIVSHDMPQEESRPVFNCRESGSTLRFFVPIALVKCHRALFTGAERLLERGIGIYEDVLKPRGVRFVKSRHGIEVEGELTAGTIDINGNVSSQYISGLMFGLSCLDEASVINVIPPVESRAYIDLTIETLKKAGIVIKEIKENSFYIEGGQEFRPINEAAEGDWSNAAFLYALKNFGNDISVTGLNENSVQSDRICLDYFKKLDEDTKSPLDISNCIDLGPVLFAYAAAKHGGHFTGTRRLLIKESDRANVMAEELEKFGVEVRVSENDVIVTANGLKKPEEELFGHNDHRIVMALSVLLTLTGGTINGAEAVTKSFPDFFEVLRRLSADVEIG